LELRQIVYATNFAPASLAVAPVAVSLAEKFQARLTLLHVIENFTRLDRHPGPIEDGMGQLKELVPMNAALQYVPEMVLEFGESVKSILKVSADRDADLIVLGARPAEDRVATTHLPWTTAHQVIANAKCPVLTVRG
jgi:universal stress protein A